MTEQLPERDDFSPNDDVDSRLFYPFLADISPEDWEDGAQYEGA